MGYTGNKVALGIQSQAERFATAIRSLFKEETTQAKRGCRSPLLNDKQKKTHDPDKSDSRIVEGTISVGGKVRQINLALRELDGHGRRYPLTI